MHCVTLYCVTCIVWHFILRLWEKEGVTQLITSQSHRVTLACNTPGQSCTLQTSISCAEPTHVAPPWHVRVLSRLPPTPQVLEQALQADQSLQKPAETKVNMQINNELLNGFHVETDFLCGATRVPLSTESVFLKVPNQIDLAKTLKKGFTDESCNSGHYYL